MNAPLLCRDDVRKIDQLALKQHSSLEHLIREVGSVLAHWLHAKVPNTHKILICVGPGHNGDDGLALAHKLLGYDYSVKIFELPTERASQERVSLRQDLPDGLFVNTVDSLQADLCVDAMFGVGLSRGLDSDTQALLHTLNQKSFERIAIDIPTGIDANTGQLWAQEPFRATQTLSLGASKPGLHLHPGYEFAGTINILPVKSLSPVIQDYPAQVLALGDQSQNWLQLQPQRQNHKYQRGVVGVVQHEQYPGAALLAAQAAQESGASYLRIYTPTHLVKTQKLQYPQFVFQSYEDASELPELLLADAKTHCWILGAGWPQNHSLDLSALNLKAPIVWDGGLLQADLIDFLKTSGRTNDLLTPHWGEAQRLFAEESQIWTSKWDCLHSFSKHSQSALLLKGYDTLICQHNEPTLLTTWNSPSLAFAGSGDLLAGLCASLIAQGQPPYLAAQLAVDAQRQVAKTRPFACTPSHFLKGLSDFLNGQIFESQEIAAKEKDREQ